MNAMIKRPYRKKLMSRGLIYMGGQEREIVVKDLSLTGVLAKLKADQLNSDTKNIFNVLTESTVIDLYLPEIRLAGEAEVVRVDVFSDHMLIALEFRNISYDVDNLLYKRKAYRKNMVAPGRILLNGEYRDFNTVNVSVDGLMINLAESIEVTVGEITIFEFDQLEVDGEIKVMWTERTADGCTLIGLQYMHMEKKEIKGIPRFVR
ncbi:PilZ domain-containing protein [Candidatus Methylobacter oryzae]|uniref:PilZ domain-containing protein n=1 Tax=Candidatus Methylobacter oryzae TaxID=2497749 RepID=A0ABY3CC90_9GAMM|nr:PilZ domain-containing protein [Candidatus Methylobacter oryzae]TRW98517.1 PilZ domain-containing protein [Candidatus Methylobacter oryzae]